MVDVGAANDEAAKAGKLHDCDGCEAKIAAGLNADQSMIGIVTRISRTDYAVTYKIRDAQSGALVDVEQTDLRAGRQFGLEPWRALADPAPSAGKGELARTKPPGKLSMSLQQGAEGIATGPRLMKKPMKRGRQASP